MDNKITSKTVLQFCAAGLLMTVIAALVFKDYEILLFWLIVFVPFCLMTLSVIEATK